jgi:3-deoxy-manno-octulosonate cytidylyltransferase (CMP-KDO synthetase)
VKNIAGIIPARWASTRFPGKPLALLKGQPVILHVWERCILSGLDRVIIATDDARIEKVCRDAGAEVVNTDPALPSGTDRCAAVARELTEPFILNIQGDEPFIDPVAIQQLGQLIRGESAPPIATLIRLERNSDALASPNVVKVVKNNADLAMYFSRQWLPFQRDYDISDWTSHQDYYVHVGMYGFEKQTLLALSSLPISKLEQAEQLEQLRWLENGYQIKIGLTSYISIGIDTPQDLIHAEANWDAYNNLPENP